MSCHVGSTGSDVLRHSELMIFDNQLKGRRIEVKS